MKMVFVLGAAACVAMPAMVHASGRPIACLYDHVAHNNNIDHGALDALVSRDMKVESGDDKLVMQRIGGEAAKCQTEYGWSRKRQQAAFGYMHARLLYDSQGDALDAHGITYAMMDDAVAAMTPELRQTYLSGMVSGDMIGDVIARLKAAGATIDDTAASDRSLEVALDKAIVAAIAEADTEQSFSTR